MCQSKHTAKADMHTVKLLPCAAHGKQHTAFRRRQRRSLPCATYRAHGKPFAVCKSRPTAKKMASSKGDVEVSLPCALPMWHTAKTEPLPCAEAFAHGKEWFLCRVPWFLHTAKVPDLIFFCLLITYMVPQAFHIYHNDYFMYPNKHHRHLIHIYQ